VLLLDWRSGDLIVLTVQDHLRVAVNSALTGWHGNAVALEVSSPGIVLLSPVFCFGPSARRLEMMGAVVHFSVEVVSLCPGRQHFGVGNYAIVQVYRLPG